ncbi:MAG: A/G-specific adenine glycosylase [Lachnospiraceae bacterium]
MDMYRSASPNLYDQLQVLESGEKRLDRLDRLKAMNRPLLAWYEEHARVLPWREQPEPYRVWISEIMLQQTRVEAVKPYFHRFMEAVPTIKQLAVLEEDRLFKLWEGLGYYNRARNLQKAAVIMAEEYGGQMPGDYESLLKLPGIGSYTAGAIASIAFGIPVPAVDGNVLRVLSRVLGSREDILKQSVKKQFESDLLKTMPQDQASHFNQGLIEVGAIVCVPNGQPKCEECPLASLCLARKEGMTGEIPVKTPKKPRKIEEKTVCILETKDQVALRKREDSGLLASLYELPNVEGHLKQEELAEAFGVESGTILEVRPLSAAKHIFSHVEWHMIGYQLLLSDRLPTGYIAADKTRLETEFPLPNAFGKYTRLIRGKG